VSCNRDINTPYPPGTVFTFTNLAGWGEGGVDHYHYIFNNDSMSTLTCTPLPGSHQEDFSLKDRSTTAGRFLDYFAKGDTIFYTGFEPGNPMGINFDYNNGGSPDEWHVTNRMLYHGTSTWITAPVGIYFCHIGDDSIGYRDGNEVGYQFHVDLSSYTEAYLYYLSTMQAYQSDTDFDKFVVWGTHEGMGSNWINLDPGQGYAWGGDWGTYWYEPENGIISLVDLVGHASVIIEFWFYSDSEHPDGFGVAIDEVLITGTPSAPDSATWSSGTLSKTPLGGSWYLHVISHNPENASGGISHYGPYIVSPTEVVSSEQFLGKIPSTFELSPNFPNPFNAKTKIQYGLPQSNHVVIRIYNTLGQTVKELVNGEFSAGYYETIWDATDMTNREVRSGIYFLHMKAADFSKTKKLLLLR
jgi:hypothetical protein